MGNVKASRTVLVLALVIVLAGGGVSLWLLNRKADPKQGDPLFREAAAESGLNFRMNYLPDEQGEKFKINLYDHGSGVAVGDYDGDGYDDIYLVNQQGRNALYRNKGDGTFEDKTEEA